MPGVGGWGGASVPKTEEGMGKWGQQELRCERKWVLGGGMSEAPRRTLALFQISWETVAGFRAEE